MKYVASTFIADENSEFAPNKWGRYNVVKNN
jgi:hypothetical protein